MKKTIITGLILSFFLAVLSFNTSAQAYTYDISKYYTPDIVRNQLDLSFNTNNYFNSSRNKVDSTITSNTAQLSGAIAPSFVTYTNTRKQLSTLQINGQINGNYRAYTYGNQDENNKTSQTTGNINLSYSTHFYNSSNQFLLLGISSDFNASINDNSTKSNSVTVKDFNRDYNLNLAPSVGVGTGRVESVEDARQAIYILEDLSKKGALTRHLTDAEIFEFSQLISHVKNKRFLDARLHLIDEIIAVDSFLVNNKVLDKSDARYFTSLYDNWEYGALYSRKSGQSFEITFTPCYTWNYANDSTAGNTYRNRMNQNSLTGALALTYTYEKPVKLNWQHSILASLKGITSFENTNNNGSYSYYTANYIGAINGYDTRLVNLNGSYSLGFYPNTRTYFRANFTQTFILQYLKDSNYSLSSWNKSFASTTSINFNAYYYLSPQLRLSLGASLANSYSKEYSYKVSSNNFYGGIGGTLSYSLF